MSACVSTPSAPRVLRALSRVDVSLPAERFPLSELLAATTLDAAQGRALRDCVRQEVAVVQGPPGTGGWGGTLWDIPFDCTGAL